MKVAIRFDCTYQYEEKASFSPHFARIFPRRDLFMNIERVVFKTHDSSDVQYRQDLFDNVIAFCFYPELLDRLDFHLELDLTLAEKNPFHFLLDAHALRMPFDYLPTEAEMLAPYLKPRGEIASLPAALSPKTAPEPTIDVVVAMNSWMFKNIVYERRDEGEAFPPEHTLAQMRGSCRDYAVLFADVLRLNGVAARLASGYLWEDDSPDAVHRAENAFHAWVEAYLPGAGWIGLDPTNGVLCDHQFIPTAVGLTPADIAPVLGRYYGKKTIGSTMTSNLSVKKIMP